MKKFVNFVLVVLILIMLSMAGLITYHIVKSNDVKNIIEAPTEIIDDIVNDNDNVETFLGFVVDYVQSDSLIDSVDDIDIYAVDGNDNYLHFTYNGEAFEAVYTPDNWTIYDSYRVRNQHDMEIICEALNQYHLVHGKDYVSYRTAQDMAYEWLQHNIAYEFLPESSYKESAKDVDLDPEDQGKSLEELFNSHR